MTIDRRHVLLGGATAALAGAAGVRSALAQSTPTPAERAAMADVARQFMGAYGVPGLAVAVAQRGRIVYEEALGLADQELGEPLTTRHRFRIASISKPITAVATYILIERSRLRLGDRVFGSGGILSEFQTPPGSYLDQITVEHLLTHTAGGWTNDASDPMFRFPKLDHHDLIAWTLLNHPASSSPGTKHAYSNFGYCVLGRVIEKASRLTYEEFVREAILQGIGVGEVEIAGNTLSDRKLLEVRYHGQQRQDPYAYNIARMDSHGGWLASPTALAQFASSVDGHSQLQILRPASIRSMTTPSAANAFYAKGWQVNRHNNWWHTGGLPGTVTIMVRTHSGFCWAALTNTRRPVGDMHGDLDRLVWNMVRKVGSWNA